MSDYATVAELKERLWPTGSTPDDQEDGILESIITAVSRQIDSYTGRRFFTTGADETRYYTAELSDMLLPDDDILSVTTMATDEDGDGTYENTWTASDYRLLPVNSALDNKPYTIVAVKPLGSYSLPVGVQAGVKIVGRFGYSSGAPELVTEACLLQCERIFKRRDAPFGIVSNPAGGQMTVSRELDADVQLMLDPLRRIR
jgi:hypothetical protein